MKLLHNALIVGTNEKKSRGQTGGWSRRRGRARHWVTDMTSAGQKQRQRVASDWPPRPAAEPQAAQLSSTTTSGPDATNFKQTNNMCTTSVTSSKSYVHPVAASPAKYMDERLIRLDWAECSYKTWMLLVCSQKNGNQCIPVTCSCKWQHA